MWLLRFSEKRWFYPFNIYSIFLGAGKMFITVLGTYQRLNKFTLALFLLLFAGS